MARERNNIYAIAADAFDLTLDTAGTIGSMVAGIANRVGLGNPAPEKSEKTERQKVGEAADRVATSLRQEAELMEPRSHGAKPANKRVAKSRSTKPKSRTTTTKHRSARKVVH